MADQHADYVAPTLGPIGGVIYDDDGTVLSFWQPLMKDGREIGRTYVETRKGEARRWAKAVQRARQRIRITPGQRRALLRGRRHIDGYGSGK
jgi:hypothetical protein